MDWLAGEFHRIENVTIIACGAFAVFYVLAIFFVKKSFVALITAVVVAAIFLWSANNLKWWRDRVRDETKQDNTADFGGMPTNAGPVPLMNFPGLVVILPGDGKR